MKAIMKYKDRIGQKFGRLTILSYIPKNHRGRYICQCEELKPLTKAPQSWCYIETGD